MSAIRRSLQVLIVAGTLSLPVLASAEQAPTEACDGEKMKEREPTADKSDPKQNTDKSGKKSQDKSEPKPEPKDPAADKS
jgi:hypothetical protein